MTGGPRGGSCTWTSNLGWDRKTSGTRRGTSGSVEARPKTELSRGWGTGGGGSGRSG